MSTPAAEQSHGFGFTTATTVVVANMIGSGVLTSIAFQVGAITSGFALLALWALGGIIAMCGAYCYAELAQAFEGSGGEFNYITRTLHPSLGFAAGWVSVFIGFAAPSASAAIALAEGILPHAGTAGAQAVGGVQQVVLAVAVAAGIALPHATNRRTSALFQQGSTWLKIITVLALLVGGLVIAPTQPLSLMPDRAAWGELATPAFATACYFVSYSYSGWNAAAYIAGEVRSARKTVGRAILVGTAFVTLLYLLLNAAFLRALPRADIDGHLDVALRLGASAFGARGADVLRVAIALLFVSGISAMILVGSRVTAALASTVPTLRWLAVTNGHGVPMRAVWAQLALVGLYVMTGTFEQLIVLSGFILAFFTVLTVLGLLRARFTPGAGITRSPWLFVPVSIFLLFTSWVLMYGLLLHPIASGLGVLVAVSGVVVWRFAAHPAT